MSPLSSCHISGIFSLSQGSRNIEPTYYAQYSSTLEFPDDKISFEVSIRKSPPFTDTLYVDDSVVFMVAKAALPARENGLLDSIYCTPFDPLPEGLESSLPEGFDPSFPLDSTHTAFVTGTVGRVDNGTRTKSFTLNTSEYVRDEQRAFDVRSV
jgi:hypothetical protein